MQCLLCGKKIPLLRKLKDPDFCSEAHRDEYAQTQSSLALSRLLESTRVGAKAVPEPVAVGKGGSAPEPEREAYSEADMLAAVSRGGPKEIYLELSGNRARGGVPAPRKAQALPVRTRFMLVAPRLAGEKRNRRAMTAAGLVQVRTSALAPPSMPRREDLDPIGSEIEISIPMHEAEADKAAPEPAAKVVRSEPKPPAVAPAPKPVSTQPERNPAVSLAAPEPAQAPREAPPAKAMPLPKDWVPTKAGETSAVTAPPAPVLRSPAEAKPALDLNVTGVSARTSHQPDEPPLARKQPWPDAWQAGWRTRNQIQDMRRLWALPVINAGTRAPQIRPAFSVDLDISLVSDPVAAALTSGTGLLLLRPPRSKPPLPPRLARVAHGDEDLLWEPSLQISCLKDEIPATAFKLGDGSLPKLIRPATGWRGWLDIEPRPQLPDGISGVPPVTARLRGCMAESGKIRLTLPEAVWGDEAVWVAPEAIEFSIASVTFGTLRLPAIEFDPPLNGLLSLRIYPRSAGSPGEWKRTEQAAPIEQRFGLVAIPESGLQPEKDWIQVGAGCVKLSLSPLAANRLPYPGRMDPEPSNAFPEVPLAGSCRMQLATIRSVSVTAQKMVSLRKGPQARQHHAPLLVPAVEPSFRVRPPARPRVGVAPKAECLKRPAPPPPRRMAVKFPSLLGPARKAFNKVPRRVRLGVMGAVAVVMAFAFFYEPSNPGKTRVGSPQKVVAAQRRKLPNKTQASWLESAKSSVAARSAVALTDDFSHGLADWEGRGDWAGSWGYDNAGFVRTGPLAIFTPTRVLTDYRMEFVGQIERRSLGWVVRAADLSNYWALKLVVGGTEARPVVTLVRYPVVRGMTGRVTERVVDLPLQADTTYRVTTDVKGDNYAVTVQGKVADSWTDSRLDRGGVGFFNNKGEQARVRWVGVWHQYDTLGRLCALLSSNSLLGNEREE
ncbi:MAG: hypothetical protein U0Q16_00875 [Bryobacteraceae bacterium]